MKVNELMKRAQKNKADAVTEQRGKIIEWCRSLYADCVEDLKKDRERKTHVYKEDWTPFDLFLDNIMEEADYASNLEEVEFLELFREFFELQDKPLTEFAW